MIPKAGTISITRPRTSSPSRAPPGVRALLRNGDHLEVAHDRPCVTPPPKNVAAGALFLMSSCAHQDRGHVALLAPRPRLPEAAPSRGSWCHVMIAIR